MTTAPPVCRRSRPDFRRRWRQATPAGNPTPDQATARPIGRRCAALPSTWHHLPAIATEHCPTLAPSSPRGRLHRSRGRRPRRTARVRAPRPATRGPDQATARPIGRRCGAPPSTWHRLPVIATEHRPTLAPPSPRGRLQRSRRRQPGRTADELHALDHSNASLPTIKARLPARMAATAACQQPDARPGHGQHDRLPMRRLVFDLAPLAGDRHQALPDAGAVVATWQASPIERTKTRKNCA